MSVCNDNSGLFPKPYPKHMEGKRSDKTLAILQKLAEYVNSLPSLEGIEITRDGSLIKVVRKDK